ncbi:PAR1 domain-containing protein [Cephalotus follicularis]|uniref:PAR1 domain-containing protein n=1 Tax=Cephalotus follicularis TaxID=3775 RepID=A0A1Q3BBQ3_CEPFO|nr:PAR1 domain-containing protein [Cephalotus follicularis]
MAPSFKLPYVLFLSSLFLHAALAELICEELPSDVCAFSIASSGKRCSLETDMGKDGKTVEYQCKTSEVVVERMSDYIETDECVRACGVDRNSVGISSDALLDPQFAAKLCSPSCYDKCPNIVDLYFNLAAGEGVFLPDLCKASKGNPHRAMLGLLSSGAAIDPMFAVSPATAPSPV